MSENYTLPIESNWTVEDIVTVSNLIDGVLVVYETGISKRILLERFDQFREVCQLKVNRNNLIEILNNKRVTVFIKRCS